MFEFLNPGWLALLPPIWWLLWLFSKRYRDHSTWDTVCDPHLLQVLSSSSAKKDSGKWLIRCLALVITLGCLAAAGPSWRNQTHPLLEPAAARVLILDLSESMSVTDVKPSRLRRAVTKAKSLVSGEFQGRTALVVFAGAPFIVSPLTEDKRTLLSFLNALDPSTMPVDGSRIDLAIQTAQRLLAANLSGRGQIIVFSDGVDRLATAIAAAVESRNQGHRLSILAVGTAEGAPLMDENGQFIRDDRGAPMIHKAGLNELEAIAAAASGRFVRMAESDDDILYLTTGDGVEFIPSRQSEARPLRTPANDGAWLVWLMLPFALLLFRKNAFWIMLIATIVPVDQNAYALDLEFLWRNDEQRAFDAYQRGEYAQIQTLSGSTWLRGAAYYRTGEYEQAASLFKQSNTADSLYNLGNALVHQEKFLEAAVAYAEALALDPGLEDAAWNKRLIEEYLNQQSGQQLEPARDSDEEDETGELSDQSGGSRSGAGQPGQSSGRSDSAQAGSGAGAQQDRQQTGAVETYAQAETADESSALQEQAHQQDNEKQAIDRWLQRLPGEPSELLRRIFHRDYRRRIDKR